MLIRTSIAYSYALGAQMMAPWDIYLPTPHAQRYYGRAAQYADLYQFVRRHAALLDATTLANPKYKPFNGTGEGAAAYNHTFSGGGGGGSKLGHRWRFPFPFTSAGYSGCALLCGRFDWDFPRKLLFCLVCSKY